MTAITSENTKPSGDLYEVFNYAKDEKHVFFTSDLMLGTTALWLPILLGIILYPHSDPWAELIKLLDAGSGYTFALPFLTASSSFIFLERARRKANSWRDIFAPDITLQCVTYLTLGLILTGVHFTALIYDKDAGIPLLNLLQVIFVFLVIRLGIKLFCLKNIDRLPDEFMQYRQQIDLAKQNMQDAAKQDEQF